jgi:DNA mismatch repair ATPase MutS
MLFTTDRQTLEDLNIFGRHGADSIYHIFNRCYTRGGAAVLEELFRYPLSDDKAINKRSGIIRGFAESGIPFPFDSALFDAIDPYLANTDERTKLTGRELSVTKKISRIIATDTDTVAIYKGVHALVQLLASARSFLNSLDKHGESVYDTERDAIRAIVSDNALGPVLESKGKLSHAAVAELDVLLRFRHREAIEKLLRHIYYLDVYISIARVAKDRCFAFPKALPRHEHIVKLEGVYHPQVPDAVPNDITIAPGSNVIFLTGANMAGKSTFMKSLSIAMFLAHMGFPVPARQMEFSVLDGIYTTINLPDDLGIGASHFYAEVLRVKKMANELKQGKNIFIVFDELFRGTNVKDAYEATIAITKAFAGKRTSLFVISTHIIEAGEVLKKACSNIRFLYLPTRMAGTRPEYTYRLENGITDDRHGMVIIKNEGILDLLGTGIKKQRRQDGFTADKQTLDDLNLLGKFKPHSIYSLFNKVKTRGGQRLLEEMFRQPMTDAAAINLRSQSFRYFQELALHFPFQPEPFMAVENYIGSGTSGNTITSAANMLRLKMMGAFLRDERYAQLQTGLIATIDALNKLKDLVARVNTPLVEEARAILSDKRLAWLHQERGVRELSLMKTSKYDVLLRHVMQEEVGVLLHCLYQLDVHIAVSNVARKHELSYAKALPADESTIHASALWHPAIDNAVANPMSTGKDSNVLFLTGANMAGKSTYMKSFGIAVYLAHMGFPVAARNMVFSVRDGLYSSINVADDLNRGYSHFYAEVLRVKTVAEQVSQGRNLVVIFDELFKGTNVKDAYDATLHITTAFERYRNCFFIISTHIIEVGEALREGHHPVQFAYMPTVMEGTRPRYTYRLTEGITSDRHGMIIIENERILNTIYE